MKTMSLIECINDLPPEERAALEGNTKAVKDFAKHLAAMQGREFVHDLDRSPGAIARLKAAMAFEGYVEGQINDERFPTSGTGITPVRYRVVPGEKLKREDDFVYRADVEARFQEIGMRFCDGAEALLPPAKDHQLGRGAHPYVAFIRGARGAFFVREYGSERSLDLNSGRGGWSAYCVFVGVCE